MHGTLSNSFQNGLAVYYVLLALMNAAFAAYYFKTARSTAGLVWAAVAGLFLLHAAAYAAHLGWVLPHSIRETVDLLMGPVVYTTLSVTAFVLVLVFRRFFTDPQVAWAVLNLSLLFAGWAMTDPNFFAIVSKPDNVPIPMLVYSVGFFTWLALHRAVQND